MKDGRFIKVNKLGDIRHNVSIINRVRASAKADKL